MNNITFWKNKNTWVQLESFLSLFKLQIQSLWWFPIAHWISSILRRCYRSLLLIVLRLCNYRLLHLICWRYHKVCNRWFCDFCWPVLGMTRTSNQMINMHMTHAVLDFDHVWNWSKALHDGTWFPLLRTPEISDHNRIPWFKSPDFVLFTIMTGFHLILFLFHLFRQWWLQQTQPNSWFAIKEKLGRCATCCCVRRIAVNQ